MNKKFTKLIAALALLVFMTPSLAGWGQTRSDVTLQYTTNNTTNMTGGNDAAMVGLDATVWSVVGAKGDNQNFPGLNKSGYIALYYAANGSNTITVTNSAGNTISSIEITYTSNSYNNGKVYVNDNEVTGSNGTYTIGATSFVITNGNTSNVQVRIKKIVITYSDSSPTVTGLSSSGAPNKTVYEAGESFDPTGLTVYANYSDDTQVDVTADVVWTPDPLTVGTTEVTGTYSGKTITIGSLVVNAVPDPNIVLNASNSPITSTSSNSNTETVTLDGIEYQNYGGYKYTKNNVTYLSINKDINGYLGNNTQLCGNIKKIVIDYYSGGASYFTMYEGSSALAETTTVSPSSNGTGNVTYTFSGNNGYFKLKLTTTGTYCNISSIKIYLYDCGPTISANAVTIPYNGTSSSIAYTINNEPYPAGTMTSAVVTASNPSGWLTVSNTLTSPIGLTCQANSTNTERTATVRLTYTYNTNETITKDVTVTQAAKPYNLTVTLSDHVNAIYVFNAASQNDPLIAEGLAGNALVPGGTEILVSPDIEAGYRLQSLMVGGTDVTSLMSGDSYTFTMNSDVTITATAEILPCYTVTLCDDNTALTELSYGAGVTLPSRADTVTYTFAGWSLTNVGGTETTTAPTTIILAGSYSPSANTILYPVYTRDEAGGTSTEWHLTALNDVDEGVYALVSDENYAFNGTISGGDGKPTTNAFSFNTDGVATSAPSGTCEITFVAVSGSQGHFEMYNSDKGYLIATKASSGFLSWTTTHTSTLDWYADNIGQTNENWFYNPVNNARLRTNNNNFRTYGGNNGKLLKLAKKVTVTSTTTYYTSLLSTHTLTINGYGNDDNVKTGWNLIASPVSANPSYVENMTSNTFDLYRFNGTANKEWENWKQEEGDHYHFGLVPGKGYLYAHSTDVDLIFTGTMATSIADVNLPYNADSDIKSLYLAGNSLQAATTFYVYDDQYAKQTVNFLTINGNGDGFITDETDAFEVGAMQGFFVQSGGAGWTLSTTDLDAKGRNVELLNVKVSRNRGTLLDNAIVSFGNALQMNKFYLFGNTTSVYIPQNSEEMAVVRSEAQGTMPVNFRANEDGQYTLTVNPENVEMNYLHLIDNMTGADIDLLQTPSYSFNATTNDYESRFKLVFASNNEDGASTGSAAFAFYSNGNWVINNAGEATLQVVDLMGRILSSETVNGSVSKSINATPGVYMIRLINGENVKVQKIVVR